MYFTWQFIWYIFWHLIGHSVSQSVWQSIWHSLAWCEDSKTVTRFYRFCLQNRGTYSRWNWNHATAPTQKMMASPKLGIGFDWFPGFCEC
jgi:hypothetical protein